MARYIFRIDDVHPGMDWELFKKLKSIFDRFDVKPLIAVIPNNKDKSLEIGHKDSNFWQFIRDLKEERWDIAMHGYRHEYVNKESGILGLHKGSEFVGLSYEEQFEKLKAGKKIMEEDKLSTKTFVAPGHAFDKNTVLALKNLGFLYISDGFGLYPFRKWDMLWVPQIAETPRYFPFGIINFCIHPQSLSEKSLDELEHFIEKHYSKIGSFSDALEWYSSQSPIKLKIYPIVNMFVEIVLRILRAIKRKIIAR